MQPRLSAVRLVAGSLLALLAACSVAPVVPTGPSSAAATPSALLASVRPAPSATPFQTPAALEPGSAVFQVAELPVVNVDVTAASSTVDGVRVTIRAASVRLAAGDSMWVTTTLENRGTNQLRWRTDGCGVHVGVVATLPYAWTYGADQPTPYLAFKDWLVGSRRNDRFPIRLEATPESLVGEDVGCADVGVVHDLPPGRRIEARSLVTAMYEYRAATIEDLETEPWRVPSGPVDLSGTFGFWVRGAEEFDEVHRPFITVHLPIEVIDGRDPDLLSAGQAIDVALGNTELRELILSHPRIGQLAYTRLTLDEALGRWTLRVSPGDDVGETVTIVVDGLAGSIVDVELG